jgi:hypothetical protein
MIVSTHGYSFERADPRFRYSIHRFLFYSLIAPILLHTPTLNGQGSPVLHAFGDSITFGGKSSDFATKSYIQIVAATKHWPLINLSYPGDQAADAAPRIYGERITSNDIYSLEFGVNDEWIYGTDPSKRDVFASAQLSELAWLSIPATKRLTAHDSRIQYSGVWTDSSLLAGVGMQSAQPGASASFLVAGTAVLVGISKSDVAGGCQMSLSIDGTARGVWNSASSIPIETYNGKTFAPTLIQQNGLSPTVHRVRVAIDWCSSPTASAFLDWVAGAGAGSGIQPATVYTLNVPRKASNFYAQYPGGSDANVANYNAAIADNVRLLAEDGLPIHLVDIWSQLNVTSDLDIDGIHPNDTGHAKIAEAFLAAAATFAAPSSFVSVTPCVVTIGERQSMQLVATNSSQPNDSFWWSLSRQFGSVSESGMYTGPSVIDDAVRTIEVIATSKGSPNATGVAIISLNHFLMAGPVNPSRGTGAASTFQFNVTNGGAVSTLNTASLLINTSPTVVNAAGNCFVKYDRAGGLFYLGADSPSGDAFPSNPAFWVGSLGPGSSSTLSNSTCTLVGTGSLATSDDSGTVLQLAISLQFKPSYVGLQTILLSADDLLGHDTNWNAAGSWTVPATILSVGPVNPSTGTGAAATFQFNVTNGSAVSTLNTASLLVDTSSTVVNAAGNCFVKYDRAGGLFYLGADSPSGDAFPSNPAFWVGSLGPGSSSTLSNSTCTLVGTGSLATSDDSGTALQLAISLQFKPSYVGLQTIFLSADDLLGHDTNWNAAGSWTIAPD